ncbi:hypothetical protein E2320_008275 [Naja naja]|nr:hypothetical protein E2320_008275 [Naja naja]
MDEHHGGGSNGGGGAAVGSNPRSSHPPFRGTSAAPLSLSPSAAKKVNGHGMLQPLPLPHHPEGCLLAHPQATLAQNGAHLGLLLPGCWLLDASRGCWLERGEPQCWGPAAASIKGIARIGIKGCVALAERTGATPGSLDEQA